MISECYGGTWRKMRIKSSENKGWRDTFSQLPISFTCGYDSNDSTAANLVKKIVQERLVGSSFCVRKTSPGKCTVWRHVSVEKHGD